MYERYRAIFEQIASHPECSRAIYNIAADALCWARKHDEARAANSVNGSSLDRGEECRDLHRVVR